MSTLRCLQQLGCSWGFGDDRVGFGEEVFTACVADGDCPTAVLQWLVHEAHCPVDWAASMEAAALRSWGERDEVLEWLQQEAAVVASKEGLSGVMNDADSTKSG